MSESAELRGDTCADGEHTDARDRFSALRDVLGRVNIVVGQDAAAVMYSLLSLRDSHDGWRISEHVCGGRAEGSQLTPLELCRR